MASLQESFGLKISPSVQYEVCSAGAETLAPVFDELLCVAAQSCIFYNDDTTARILELNEIISVKEVRKGVYTTGLIAEKDGNKVALYRSGNQHAGENLQDLLERRKEGMPPPLQMCDGLSHNVPKDFKVILSNCLAHARRKFIEIKDAFPQETLFIVQIIAKAYANDKEAKDLNLTPEERLKFHQEKSKPSLDHLKKYLDSQMENKKVEPNSTLGAAIQYCLKRWDSLTQFITTEGAPLDNNLCERALRTAVIHRKNALFFKTLKGAGIGDLYMSIIHTCKLNTIDPMKYITTLLSHPKEIEIAPHKWMPWNFEENLIS